MKVLMVTPYVTINSRRAFTKNKTGFGYMVYDIAKSVATLENVDMLVTNVRYNGFEQDRIVFRGINLCLIIRHLSHVLPLYNIQSLFRRYSITLGTRVRVFYYWLLTGYLTSIIKEGEYDVVHIHGCGFFTELWIRVCIRQRQRYIITLHGLNSFSDTIQLSAGGKLYERDFIQRVIEGKFPITVISTGMKRLIEKEFGIDDCKSIMVVCNSFSFSVLPTICARHELRDKYNIPDNAKVLLYVGNISKNKNQKQMVRVFGLLPEDIAVATWVLFCGEVKADYSDLKEDLKNHKYESHLIFCGGVPKEVIADYYSAADGVVLFSYSEGFGLSLIEGMHFGLPCAMFSDMDAFEDIYDSSSVVPIKNRNDDTVVAGVIELLSRKWDSKEIKKSSQRFDNQRMALNYIRSYQRIIKYEE